ncbi:MAG TPA: hypothetical protein VIK75_08525 [Calditerricola sp.]
MPFCFVDEASSALYNEKKETRGRSERRGTRAVYDRSDLETLPGSGVLFGDVSHHHGVSQSGRGRAGSATGVILTGVLPFDEALATYIEWKTLALLVGMMILVVGDPSFLDYCGVFVAQRGSS